MNSNKDFKPFVPANKTMPEFTATSVILGVILAVVFGGANAYLGLRVGMTVSASIPAAVLSMGIIRKMQGQFLHCLHYFYGQKTGGQANLL